MWWSSSLSRATLDACLDRDSFLAKADPALLRCWGAADEVSGIVGFVAPLQLARYPATRSRLLRSGKQSYFRCAQLQRSSRPPCHIASRKWGPSNLSRNWKLNRAMVLCVWSLRWTFSNDPVVIASISGLSAGESYLIC